MGTVLIGIRKEVEKIACGAQAGGLERVRASGADPFDESNRTIGRHGKDCAPGVLQIRGFYAGWSPGAVLSLCSPGWLPSVPATQRCVPGTHRRAAGTQSTVSVNTTECPDRQVAVFGETHPRGFTNTPAYRDQRDRVSDGQV